MNWASVVAIVVLAGPFDAGPWSELPAASRLPVEHATHLEILKMGEERVASFHDFKERVFVAGDWARDLYRRRRGTGIGISAYPVLEELIQPPPTVLPALRKALLNAAYGRYNKLCGPLRPNIAYRFHAPEGTAELLICFHCREADLVVGDKTTRLQLDAFWEELLSIALISAPLDPQLGTFVQHAEEEGSTILRRW